MTHRNPKVRHEIQQLTEDPAFQRKAVTRFNEAIYILLNLPFSNDDILIRIIRKLRKFEGFHIIFICNKLLVLLLEACGDQIALFQNESENLIDLCHSYCVAASTDGPRRISLSEFSAVVQHAIDHCLKSQRPANSLLTVWVSNYLKFFKVLIVANIAENDEKSFKESSGAETVLLFRKCVDSFETRLKEQDFFEILDVSIAFAELDGNLKDYKWILPICLESARPVANLLMKWIKLLQFPLVSNNFAVLVARNDEMLNKRSDYAKKREETGYIPNFERESLTYRIADAIQCLKTENERFEISQDQERLAVFFKNYNFVSQHTMLSLILLSSEHFSCIELSEIFTLLGNKIIKESIARSESFWLLSRLLLRFQVGQPILTILRLWNAHFAADNRNTVLRCLLEFASYPIGHFENVNMEKHVYDLSEFLSGLPNDLLRNIHLWNVFFICFIRGFGLCWNRFSTDKILIKFFNERLSCLDMETNRILNHDKFQNLETLVQCLTDIAELNIDVLCKENLMWSLFEFLKLVPSPALFTIVARDLIPRLCFLDAAELIEELKKAAIRLDSKGFSDFLAVVSSVSNCNDKAIVREILTSLMRTYQDSQHSRSNLALRQHGTQLNLRDKSNALNSRSLSDSLRMESFSVISEWLLTQRDLSAARLEIVTASMEVTLGYNEQLCTTFRDQLMTTFQSVSSQGEIFDFLVAATAGALSASTFDFQIDPLCILALGDANDLAGYQLLSLYRHVRAGFLEVKHLMSQECVAKDLAKSLNLLISCRAQMHQKICLIQTFFWLFLGQTIKPPNYLYGAITLIVPTTYTKFIIDSLNDLQLMNVLGRIWEGSCRMHSEHTSSAESLSSVLARRFPEAFVNKDAMKIYRSLLIFSEQSHIFLCLLMSLVRQLLEQSHSLSTFFNKLKNLEEILRKPGTTTPPVLLMCLKEAYRNSLEDAEIEMLTQTVFCGLVEEGDLTIYVGFDVPKLLVAIFKESEDVEERTKLVQRCFQILAKIPKELASRIISKVGMDPCVSKSKSVLSLGLKWIVQSSSLSLMEAILVLELCLDALSLTAFPWPSCSSVSPNETANRTLQSKSAGLSVRNSISATANANLQRPLQESTTDLRTPDSNKKSSEPENSKLLTPAIVAHDLIVIFRKLASDHNCAEDRVETSVKQTFHYLFSEPKGFSFGGCCFEEFQIVTEKVFSCLICILMSSKSLEAPLYWLELSHHHFVQCSEIILNACKWYPAKAAEILDLQRNVMSTLTLLNSKSDVTGSHCNRKCYQGLKNQIEHISLILSLNIKLEMTSTLLELTISNSQLSSTCAQIISVWTDELEKKNLVQELGNLHAQLQTTRSTANDISFIYKLLVPAGRIFVNSVEDVLHARNEIISIVKLQEKVKLERCLPWISEMLQSSISCKAIDIWCTSFLFAKDITSRDVDAICNLTEKAFVKMPSAYESVTQCLFTEDIVGRLWSKKSLLEDNFKRCLRLARLLNEFVTISQQTTSVTTNQEGEVIRILAGACQTLCQHFLENTSSSRKLYKIHHDTLVMLFYHIFCDKDDDLAKDCTKSDEIEESVHRRLKDGKVFDVMLLIMRRWLTSIQKRPQLSQHVRNIVQIVMSANPKNTLASKVPLIPRSNIQSAANVDEMIQCYVESLEGNQAAVALLQTARYNQVIRTTGAGADDTLDLWSSPSIELPCYVNRNDRPEEKILAQNLRTLWAEWKDILNQANIGTVKVNGAKVEIKSLFNYTNNFQELELQAEAVKEVTKGLSSENFVHWRQDLLRREELQRRKFKKLRLNSRVNI